MIICAKKSLKPLIGNEILKLLDRNFFTGASFSIVMPFMALYVEELGVKGAMVEWYAGLSVALSALASALVSPVWGHLADRYGRKPMMIRASMVMTFTMGGLAFVPNVFWMLF